MKWKLLILALLWCSLFVVAASSAREGSGPVPQAAKVSLHFSADRFRIGENIQMIFRLENTGEEPFSYSHGGDYRGTGFPLRCEGLFELRARWRNFLQTHREDLISGKRFSYLDPVIEPLMVSAHGEVIFESSLPDGKRWPER